MPVRHDQVVRQAVIETERGDVGLCGDRCDGDAHHQDRDERDNETTNEREHDIPLGYTSSMPYQAQATKRV